MPRIFRLPRTALCLIACAVGAGGAGLAQPARAKAHAHSHPARHAHAHKTVPSRHVASTAKTAPDAAGHRHVGKASFYSGKFAGRKMADGSRMDPHGDNAASKTLPLGSRARVTNLETGKSAVVTIRDRGPHVKGRIVDLSPATAQQVGIRRGQGVANVEVTPLPGAKAGGTAPEAKTDAGAAR